MLSSYTKVYTLGFVRNISIAGEKDSRRLRVTRSSRLLKVLSISLNLVNLHVLHYMR